MAEDFAVARTRDEPLFAGPRDINQIPATLVLNRRWNWKRMKAEDNALPFDPAQADTAGLKKFLKNWQNAFSKRFLNQDLRRLNTEELDALSEQISTYLDAAKE